MTYYQLDSHVDIASWPEWGSAPRGPVLTCDNAHAGELMDSIIGPDAATGEPMVYHIIRCELCISTHVWPLPSQDALAQYYANQFYQVEKPEYIARYEQDRSWWEQCVHTPILRQCIDNNPWVFSDNKQASSLRVSRKNKRVLDIGAGPGIALDVARNMGLWTYAVEPNEALALRLRENNDGVYHGTLEDVAPYIQSDFSNKGFDILYLYETLEHQPCPEDFLLHCYDLLAPGGVIAIVVPNDYNPLQLRACQEYSLKHWWLAPPQHLHYFTPKTLQLLVRRCGLTLCDMRTTWPLEQAIFGGRNYIGNDVLGRQLHQERMAAELHDVHDADRWDARMARYRGNMINRIGREIVCIARKD